MQKKRIKTKLKLVRVDPRTLIEVDIDIPDDIAVKEYLLKIGEMQRKQVKNYRSYKDFE